MRDVLIFYSKVKNIDKGQGNELGKLDMVKVSENQIFVQYSMLKRVVKV